MSKLVLAAGIALAGLFPTTGVATDFLNEGERGTARVFQGEGQPHVFLPNCRSVERVFVGSSEVPAYVTHEIPMDADGKVLEKVEYPLWTLAPTEDGQIVLLRANLSNDGIWQAGAEITVIGEWEEEAPSKPSKKSATPPTPPPSKPEGEDS